MLVIGANYNEFHPACEISINIITSLSIHPNKRVWLGNIKSRANQSLLLNSKFHRVGNFKYDKL